MRDTPTFDANWSLIPAHMHRSIERYIMFGEPVGSFLTALLTGAGLVEVVGLADDKNQAALIGWARFLYNEMPSQSRDRRKKSSRGLAAAVCWARKPMRRPHDRRPCRPEIPDVPGLRDGARPARAGRCSHRPWRNMRQLRGRGAGLLSVRLAASRRAYSSRSVGLRP